MNGSRTEQYVLSLKDICTLESIPELVEAGISSFKIEGRMKKPEYVALVTAMYRKYLDLYLENGKEAYHVDEKDKEKLMDLYNRGGFHEGYYHTHNGREMVSLTRPNHAGVAALKVLSQNGKQVFAKALVNIRKGDVIELPAESENFTFAFDVKRGQDTQFVTYKKQPLQKNQILNRTRNERLLSEIQQTFLDKKIKNTVIGQLLLLEGEPAKLSLTSRGVTAFAEGEVVQRAMNQPILAERIEKQIGKMGNTEFEMESLEIEMSDSVFMPMQSLNELRRAAIQQLEEEILCSYRRKPVDPVFERMCSESSKAQMPPLYVYVEQREQWEEALRYDRVRRIYLDCNAVTRIWENPEFLDMIQKTHEQGKEIYLAMPHIFRKSTVQQYEQSYKFLFEANWDGVLIRNYESYQFLNKHRVSKPIITDFNLYQFNGYAKKFWKQEQVESTTAPWELNYKELKEVGLEQSEFIVYGHVPMMISAQCVVNATGGCKKQKQTTELVDRYRKSFVVKNLCDYCYNIIYNTLPTVLTDQKDDVLELHPKALRMNFTIESKESVRKMLDFYEDVFYGKQSLREPDVAFTRGHFRRGIK